MAGSDIYIKKVTVENGVEHVYEETLVTNGNAFQFDCNLQTGDGAVTQLTGNTNNYSPTNWKKKKNFVINASTTINITGCAAGEPWQEVHFWNSGANAITFVHDDTTNSDAANCFLCPNDTNVVLNKNEMLYMIYDDTANKWRIKK